MQSTNLRNLIGKSTGLWIIVSLLSFTVYGQQKGDSLSLTSELKALYDIASLPGYRSATEMFQVSSYDTTGGNDDGFSGKYSFLRKDDQGHLVIFDTQGSGVINRIWTPTPNQDTLDFYLDDTTRPSFSIAFIDLFSGKVFPFVSPLSGNELGGYYCYVPIPFQRHCKIVSRGEKMQFYQIQCRMYPEGTPVKTFQMQLNSQERKTLEAVGTLWQKEKKQVSDFTKGGDKLLSQSKTIVIKPGETKNIFTLREGGRIVGIEITPAESFAGIHKQLDLSMRWDDEATAAVDCPVADFFGYGFGQPSMQSLLLGSKNNRDYCYLPMPFDKKADIAIHYRQNAALPHQDVVQLHATVYYTTRKRDAEAEGKFYTQWNSRKEYQTAGPHVFLQTKGKGHYVGTILQAQGLNPGMTLFFEGDDSTAIDGTFRMHGTGSEDYFDGGWYALVDRWDGAMSLPIHGALTYSLPLARTGGYRLFLSDKIPFEKSFYQSIEHGPTDNIPAYYTSLALYYSDRPPAEVTKPENAITDVFIPDTLMMYPQLMQFTTTGHVDLKFEGPLVLSGDNGSLVRINLDEIPPGKYKLYMDLNKDQHGTSFSVWQRQKPLTAAVSTYQADRAHVGSLYLCDIGVEKLKNTLTIKFITEGDRKSLSLNRLIFIRKQER